MKTLKFALILFCSLFTLTLSQAQSNTDLNKKIPVDQLREDFQILRSNLEAIHTGLYTYTSKEIMDSAFHSILVSINEPMSSIAFYRKITPLHRMIKNGHTGILPSESFDQALSTTIPRFPLDVYWDKGTLYVLRNNTTHAAIKEGMAIKSINGQPAAAVFKKLVSQWTRDGQNITKPQTDIYENFDFFYAYFIGTPDEFNLEISTPDGKSQDFKVKGLPKPEIKKNRQRKYGKKASSWMQQKEPALRFRMENGTAIMTIKDFSESYYKSCGQDYKQFFQNSFQQLKAQHIQHLIIDLRDNGGGSSEPVATLLSYLRPEPFRLFKNIATQRKKIPNPGLYQHKIRGYNLFSFLWLKKSGGLYHYKWGEYGLKPTAPCTPTYQGKVYVLINANSFSATGEVAAMLQDANIGTFIGEEAGGNSHQNTSGYRPVLILPHSKLRALIPTERFLLNVHSPNTGHGVIPDYAVRPSIQDILGKKDVVLNFTLNLIYHATK